MAASQRLLLREEEEDIAILHLWKRRGNLSWTWTQVEKKVGNRDLIVVAQTKRGIEI